MKTRIIIIAVVSVVLGLGFVAARTYWRDFRGAGPAFLKPPQNIADLIEQNKQSQRGPMNRPQNTTGMPLTLPPGFSISVFARDMGAPRVMTHDPSGTLLVSVPSRGTVVALPDADGDGKADDVVTVVSGLNRPHGLAFYCAPPGEPCSLYIAESDQVARYEYDTALFKASNKTKILDLPDGGRHFTRTIAFMPYPNQDKLLISVGSSCDVCYEDDDRRAAVLIASADGSGVRTFATGLRNAVFMALHPVDGRVWATEMGRDHLGDDLPPDEINIVEDGRNYGWPVCYGRNIHDTVFDTNTYIRNPCEEPAQAGAHISLPAHSSPLGITFIPEEGWPEQWWHHALVAYHGSWNRSVPTGYKIVRVKLGQDGMHLGTEDFITGWLTESGALGRPVDTLALPGGVLLISDDKAGVIYRVTYDGETPVSAAASGEFVTGTGARDLIRLDNLRADDLVQPGFTVSGAARGMWYFEASFPILVLDARQRQLGSFIAQARGEWMTREYVDFSVQLDFESPQTPTGYIIFGKDNASGLPEHDDMLVLPVRFR